MKGNQPQYTPKQSASPTSITKDQVDYLIEMVKMHPLVKKILMGLAMLHWIITPAYVFDWVTYQGGAWSVTGVVFAMMSPVLTFLLVAIQPARQLRKGD